MLGRHVRNRPAPTVAVDLRELGVIAARAAGMSDGLQESWPAAPAAVPSARAAVVAFARAAGASAETVDDVRLAVSEAVTNVVMHAYAGSPPGPLHISARIRGRRLAVEVRDEGSGIRPRLDSSGLGVGLPLIAAVTESLTLSSEPGEPSCVSMTFDLDAVRDAAA